MDILTTGEVSNAEKWNRMSVMKLTTVEITNLPVEIRKKGLLVYNTDINDLLVNKGDSNNPNFRYLFEEVGSMELYGGDPDELFQHWKICNGQSLSIADYPDLYAVIGTTFGHTLSTHFNIPDYRNKFPRGHSIPGGIGGANKVELTINQMPSHAHTYKNHSGNFGTSGGLASGGNDIGSDYRSATEGIQSTGDNDPHENKPPYLKLHMIIKVQ